MSVRRRPTVPFCYGAIRKAHICAGMPAHRFRFMRLCQCDCIPVSHFRAAPTERGSPSHWYHRIPLRYLAIPPLSQRHIIARARHTLVPIYRRRRTARRPGRTHDGARRGAPLERPLVFGPLRDRRTRRCAGSILLGGGCAPCAASSFKPLAGSVRGVLQKPAVAGGHGMLVMFDVIDLARLHAMTTKDATRGTADLKALVASTQTLSGC